MPAPRYVSCPPTAQPGPVHQKPAPPRRRHTSSPLPHFFQADDGIRDYKVTGSSDVCSSDLVLLLFYTKSSQESCVERVDVGIEDDGIEEIGRASCRERVEISVVAVSLKK